MAAMAAKSPLVPPRMARTFPAKNSAPDHPLRARKVSPVEQP
eukprot:COSAG01_NODE_55338_length_325_cov_33.367257_1_plen_41_part_10